MELTDKHYVKIAGLIEEQLQEHKLQRLDRIRQSTNNLSLSLEQLLALKGKLEKCVSRNWYKAAEKLASKIKSVVRNIPSSVINLEQAVDSFQAQLPTARLLFEELKQVQDEFGKVEYNGKEQTLSVFTEPIELEGVFLGDFEIKLQIEYLSEINHNELFRIIALDSHPAACNEEVTHPHVSDEYLCMGDATVPIQDAISSGRICDFYILVRSVLQTYNPSSPYVALSEWDGISCYECGYSVPSGDVYVCEACESSFCDECVSTCSGCNSTFCKQCLAECKVCEEPLCNRCFKVCSQCKEMVCESCIENYICNSCLEEMENNDEQDESELCDSSTESQAV